MATDVTPIMQVKEKEVQKTVFDLDSFDFVLLKKMVTLPPKPASLDEALKLYNNQADVLLDLIYAGMEEKYVQQERDKMEGFRIVDEDDELGDEYHGTYADKDKAKLINNAVLSFAKMLGYNKQMTADEKRAIKETARKTLRETPAILKSIQG